MFADRKLALGFAGVTVAFALVAALSVGAFLPDSEGVPPVEQPVEGEQLAQAPTPQEPAATWADEGFSDDWNASAVDTANGNAGWNGPPGNANDNAIEFGDYAPETRGGAAGRPQPSARVASAGSPSPTITSSAAPGAPNPEPPDRGGNEGPPEITIR